MQIICCDETRQGISKMNTPSHAKNVLTLYKAIFRLHRSLPPELKAIGDAYLRQEFKQHKDAEPAHAVVFMQEWTVGKKFLRENGECLN